TKIRPEGRGPEGLGKLFIRWGAACLMNTPSKRTSVLVTSGESPWSGRAAPAASSLGRQAYLSGRTRFLRVSFGGWVESAKAHRSSKTVGLRRLDSPDEPTKQSGPAA